MVRAQQAEREAADAAARGAVSALQGGVEQGGTGSGELQQGSLSFSTLSTRYM